MPELVPDRHQPLHVLFPQHRHPGTAEPLEPIDDQGLGHDLADGPTWVQRRDRVLEDHLHLRANVADVFVVEVGQILGIELHRTGGGWWNLHHGSTCRGLAATGFTDQAERLTLTDVDAHIRYSVDLQSGVAHRKLHNHVLDSKQAFVFRPQVSLSTASHQIAASFTSK